MPSIFDGFNLSNNLNQFKRNTNNSVQGIKGNVLTPIDATTERLNEGMALTTPNDTSVKGTITSYKSSVVEALDGVVGAISGGLLNTKNITKAIKVDRDGVKFSTDDIITAAAGAMGYNVWGQNGAMQGIGKGITDEFNRLTGLNFSQLITTSDGKFAINKNWRGQTGQQVLRMVRDVTGMDEFLDVSVQSSLYNSILYQASGYGMYDSYRTLWDKYPYAGLRQDAFIQAMQVMITNGDIRSIDKVIQLLDREGRNTLLNKYPDFVTTLFAKFSFADDVYPEDHPELLTKLLGILEIVVGPNWWLRETQFGQAYNLGLTTGISKDMVTLLTPVDYLVPLLATRGMFQEGSAAHALNSVFRDAPIDLL